MIPRSRLLIVVSLLAALLVATPVVGGAETFTDRADAIQPADPQPAPDIQTAPETDTTTTRITVHPNGSAVWQLTIRMELETEADETEFGAFEEEFARNRSQYVGEYRNRMTGVVDNAEQVTGREMSASGFEAETGVQETAPRYGYVTYRFTWDGLAETGDGTTTVGDIFDGGYFLGTDDILIVDIPAGYEVAATDPTPDRATGGELQWNGPRSFVDERPQAEFTTGDRSGSTDNGQPAPEPTTRDDSSVWLVLGGLLLVLVVAGVAYGRHYRKNGQETDRIASDAASTTAAPPAANGSDSDGLATDEDRIRTLLESEGGRMRQAEIADRLGWSASKTSRVLSKMADNGEIEKLRIGRENVIDLPDEN